MSDFISRQDALDAVNDCGICIQKILDLPSAETERKKGKWKPFDLTWGRSVYSCTACGKAVDIPTEMSKPIYNYCPNCGADMRGDK